MSCCSRSARPTDCHTRMTSSSVEIALRAAVHVRIALDDEHLQPELAQQVRGGRAGRSVADHRHVVGICTCSLCSSLIVEGLVL